MFVCCKCCVLSGRDLCDEPITRPEESYRLWCAVVCDPDPPKGGQGPRWAAASQGGGEKNIYIIYIYICVCVCV